MKSNADSVRARLCKAESDLASAGLCLSAGESLDTACFHAQQAAGVWPVSLAQHSDSFLPLAPKGAEVQ